MSQQFERVATDSTRFTTQRNARLGAEQEHHNESHTSRVRLAVASSPLLLPLEAAASQPSASDIGNYLLLLMIVAALGIVALATLNLRRLARVLDNDDYAAPGERCAEAEPDELLRSMQDTVEQLDCISALLRTATDALTNAVDNIASPPKYVSLASNEECTAAAERLLPARQSHERIEGNRDTPTTPKGIADGVSLIDAISSQTNLLALGVAAEAARIGSRHTEAGAVANEMRMLAEHCQLRAQEIGAVAKSSATLAARAGNLLTCDKTPTPFGPKTYRHLEFTIGDDHYAVSTLNVREILTASGLTPEPSMPPSMRGVIDLYGARVPVIDLATHIGGESIEIGWNTRIVVLAVSHDDRQHPIGVLVDAVHEIAAIRLLDNAPPAALAAHVRSDFIQGTGMLDGRLVTLLDVGRGLSSGELVAIAAFGQVEAHEEAGA